jgi:hypothetical protein
MVDVFSPHILNPKVINNHREGDRAGEMLPQTRCMFTLVIFMGEEPFAEELIRQDTSLEEAPYGAAHFNVYESFFAYFSKLYCSLVQYGKRESSILTYLNQSSGAVK